MMGDESGVDSPRHIPDELLIEILARMPVKSLIKFTCVCKFWLSLIKSPKFAAKQYATRKMALSQQNGGHDCHFFTTFPQRCSPVGKIDLISYETLEISTVFECKPVNSQPAPSCSHDSDCKDYGWIVWGPCNGIFCVQVYKPGKPLLLWNPSTRQVFNTAKPKCALSQFLGFGFDDYANDYKIVTFHCYNSRGPHDIQLYSLAANSWRDIEDSTLTFGRLKSLIDWESSSLNGRMCSWLGYDCQLDNKHNVDDKATDVYFLLSFDMVDEVFVETPVPDGVVEYIRQCSFVQQRSHLSHPALVSYGLESLDDDSGSKVTYVNVWILHEYGAAGYWTKQLSVMLPDHIIVARPRGFWKDDEILFMGDHNERVLTCYNHITQELKTLNSIHVDAHQQLIGYIESLLPIQTFSQHLGECEDSDNGPDYCLCEVNQPLSSNSCIF